MNIHDFRDKNDVTMRAGFVLFFVGYGTWMITVPPQRTRMHRIRIHQNLQHTTP